MWLIACRTAAQQWRRLLATLATVALTVGLVAGSTLLGQQARTVVTRIRASEYARTAVIVRAPGAVIPGTDPSGVPAESRAGDGRLGADVAGQVATVPGVAAVAGDAAVPADLVGADHKVVTSSGGAPTLLRPWVADPSLSAYRLVAGRAPAAAGEVAVVRSLARAGRLQVGATTTLILPQDIRTVRVVGIVTIDGADAAARGAMVLAPSRGVQEAAGLEGAWPVLMVGAADRAWHRPPAGLAACQDRLGGRRCRRPARAGPWHRPDARRPAHHSARRLARGTRVDQDPADRGPQHRRPGPLGSLMAARPHCDRPAQRRGRAGAGRILRACRGAEHRQP